ncbi:MAG: hypothetical protein JNJ70_17775 [Verrucomicrobiales bacterium]|nr:hypothetical protein [Verrucomicrobiales bacterium]
MAHTRVTIMINRRQSRWLQSLRLLAIRLWQMRRVLLLVIPYFLLFGWLFSGNPAGDVRPDELYGIRETPQWKAPDGEHWFGTAANGADLFDLTRLALARTASVAVVAVSVGIGLALLVTMLFVFDPREDRFAWLGRFTRASVSLPGMVVLVILAGGSGGGVLVVMSGLALLVVPWLCPVLCRWFEEGEEGFEIVAARVLGLSRREIVLGRVLPFVLRRLPGVFAVIVPVAMLVEMALSFLGFHGDRLNLGLMIERGQVYLIEAPWMAIYPGMLATVVVAAFSLLGWRVFSALRTGPLPPYL